MKRRDTIIIAVLVNAGILLVLFATALRSKDKKSEAPSQLAEFNLGTKPGETPLSTEDLLNEYIASTTLPQGQEETPEIVDLSSGPGVTPIVAAPQTPVTLPQQIQPVQIQPVQGQPISSLPAVQPAAPVAAPIAPVLPKEEVVEVTVKKGDYLEKIAKANSSSVNAIMKANNLASTQLKIGQILKVPVVKGKEPVKETTSNIASAQDADFYIVKEGDSPWAIASKCHIKIDDLLKMNNIDDQKAKRLRPGDKLRIR